MYKSQEKANKKWCENNREYSNYLKNRSACKSFIKNKATESDLMDIYEIINIREKILNNKEIK